MGAACLHAWVSAYWYRGSVWYAKRLVARADRLRIFHPDLRWTFLSGRSPDRFGNPTSRWSTGQRIRFVFFLLCVFVALAKVLGAISNALRP